jgi:hypothetical protein
MRINRYRAKTYLEILLTITIVTIPVYLAILLVSLNPTTLQALTATINQVYLAAVLKTTIISA